jgi:hypothetical protein
VELQKVPLMHLRQHLILEALVIHGYTGIDAGSKVHYLLNGIRCAALKMVRTRIMSDEDLHQDFARCVTLFKDFVKQSAQVPRAQLGIAAMTVTPGGGQAKAIGDGPVGNLRPTMASLPWSSPKNNTNSVLLQRNQYFLPKPTTKTASAP